MQNLEPESNRGSRNDENEGFKMWIRYCILRLRNNKEEKKKIDQ